MHPAFGYRKSMDAQKGATMVEFAIAIVLLLILIFGIIEIGLYVLNRQIIVNACREGARFGVVIRNPRHSDEEIRAEIVSRATDRLVTFDAASNTLNLSFSRVGPGCNNMSDCTLNIAASYRYTFLILPDLVGIIRPLGVDPPDFVTINEAVAMRYE